jgi:hypothetical protein
MARPGQWCRRSPSAAAAGGAATAALGALLGLAAGPTVAAAAPTPGAWHVYLAEAETDTLAAPADQVRPAAARAFTDDHWTISGESTSVRVVTGWKAFHHPLARLLLGDLRARCVVDMRALGADRTLVRFQGGLASQSDVAANPAFAAAQIAYRTAVKGWYRDVREGIAGGRRAGTTAAAGVAAAP